MLLFSARLQIGSFVLSVLTRSLVVGSRFFRRLSSAAVAPSTLGSTIPSATFRSDVCIGFVFSKQPKHKQANTAKTKKKMGVSVSCCTALFVSVGGVQPDDKGVGEKESKLWTHKKHTNHVFRLASFASFARGT